MAWHARIQGWDEGPLAGAVGRRGLQEVVFLRRVGDAAESEEMAVLGLAVRLAGMETDRVRLAVVPAHTTDTRGGGCYTGAGRWRGKR